MTGALCALLLDRLAASRGRVDETGGPGLSAPEVVAAAERVAEQLRARGVRPREPVLVTVGNRAADVAALLGAWEAGAVAVPIHRAAAPLTREGIEGATRARLLVEGTGVREIAAAAPPDRPLLDGAALVLFTSGSTGNPKGVVLGHDRFARKLAILDPLLTLWPDDVVVLPLQLTFIFGLWVALLTIRSGARLVLVDRFSAGIVAGLLADGASALAAVPTMLRAMPAAATPAPRLRTVIAGGEVLDPGLAGAIAAGWPGAEIVDFYGSTETGACDFHHVASRRPGSIGRPTEGVAFRILREDGSAAPPGEGGELAIRSGCAMLGYLDDPALTVSSVPDGYVRTGDLARALPDGRVEIVGRRKEIISRGGNKVSPLEIEGVLCRHDGVAAALCAGVPDARLGQAIHAVVVLKAGASLDAEALRAWAGQQVERYKVPDVIRFRDALPSGATGKASRAMIALDDPAG